MPDELLSCPFCGDEGLLHRVPWGWQVSCEGCGAAPRSNSNSNRETEEGAVAVWNTRAALQSSQPREEAVEREELGKAYAALRWIYKHGMQPHPVRPEWVSNVFHSAFEPPLEQENTEEREQIAENANCSTAEAQPRSPVDDALSKDEAESAFFTLIGILDGYGCAPAATIKSYDDGGVSLSVHFSAERARKLIAANAQSPAIDPRVEELVEAAKEASGLAYLLASDVPITAQARAKIARLDTALAAFGGKTG